AYSNQWKGDTANLHRRECEDEGGYAEGHGRLVRLRHDATQRRVRIDHRSTGEGFTAISRTGDARTYLLDAARAHDGYLRPDGRVPSAERHRAARKPGSVGPEI